MAKMSSRGRGLPNGLKLSLDHMTLDGSMSQSYLIQPEMSPSPTQFSLSPNYRYIPNGQLAHQRQGYSTMDGSMLLGSTSMSPLLPQTPSHCGFIRGTDGRISNRVYGVGDLEHVHIDGMNNRPINKEYDYADYGHQYEELPGGRKSMFKHVPADSGNDSRSEYQSSGSGGPTDMVSESGDMAHMVNQSSDKRKRVNPLYDGMTQSMPSIYNKTKPDVNESLRKQVRCLKCCLIIFMVISCAAIAVSVFAVISSINAEDNATATLSPKVQMLVTELQEMEDVIAKFEGGNSTLKVLSDLSDKLNRLQTNTSQQISFLQQQLQSAENAIQMSAGDSINAQNNLSQIISQLNLTIQLQLHNISKMEGPRGPQGVANFSMCFYKNVSNNAVASDFYSSYSPWTPTETELETNFGFFAGCSVDGGTQALVETNAISPDHVQYRCKCSGTEENKSRRICYVHVICCPRNS